MTSSRHFNRVRAVTSPLSDVSAGVLGPSTKELGPCCHGMSFIPYLLADRIESQLSKGMGHPLFLSKTFHSHGSIRAPLGFSPFWGVGGGLG
ncbi:hypothetical protein NPIL_218171 [Nephila pilipes]|uniref:Uncharacterized protein n=1 Tax=Nephila pilipes TaxID=299642 RepID=A0A8X6TRJ9_NEPPI|nr:hypothetical protein NPIL_218171 [Nephila pilipes]